MRNGMKCTKYAENCQIWANFNTFEIIFGQTTVE